MSTGARRLLARQGRAHAGALAVVAVVVLVTSFLACAAPRALSHVYDEGLVDALSAAGPTGRDLVATTSGNLPLGRDDDPLAAYERATQVLLENTDPALRAGVRGSTYSLTSQPLSATVDLGGDPRQDPATRLQLRAADDWQDQVRVVEGALPSGDVPEVCDAPAGTRLDPQECVVEIALSAAAAPDMDVAVGDLVPLGPSQAFGGEPILVRVAGLFEPLNADADYWSRAGSALFPYQFISDDTGLNNEGIAFVDPRAYPFVQRQVIGITSSQVAIQLFTEPTAFTADDVQQVHAALGRLPLSTLDGPSGPITLRLRSQLDSVLEDYVAQQATADAVMSVALAGLLAVALAVLALAARLVTERRRVTVRLAAARGASGRQLAGWQALEGLAVAAPAAVTGSVLAAGVVGGRGGVAAVAVPGLLVAATAVLVPAIGRAEARGTGRRDLWRRLAGPGRLVLELSVVTLAVAGALTLRRRGLTTSAAELGTDPLLVSVPVLLAVAAGLVVLRAYPIPLRRLGSLVARRGDAVPFLGLARSGREVAGGAAPVIVLLLGLTMAVFASVISSTLARGGLEASWQNVGADIRVAGTNYTVEDLEATRAVDGVAAAAPAVVSYDGAVGRLDVAILATDVDAYREVQRGNPVAPPLPASLSDRDGALPAVVSSSLAGSGEQVAITLRGNDLSLDVVATAATLPGIDPESEWVLVPLDGLRQATGRSQATGTVYVALDASTPRDEESMSGVIDDLTTALPTTVAVTTRADEAREVAESGLVSGVRDLFAAGVATGAAYAALAVALALVVTSRQRDVVLSQLRTLGLSGHQARSLVALEIVPLAAASGGTGLLLGLATPFVLAPAIDLRPFTGSDLPVPLTVDVVSVVALAVGFAAVVALAVLGVTAANRRRVLGSVLRVGEEA